MEQQRLTTDYPPPPPSPHFPHNHRKKKKLIITTIMAGLLSLTLFSFLLFFFISAATRHHSNLLKKQDSATATIISQACKASRDPATCQSYLTQHVPPNPTTVLQTIQTALNASSQNLRTGQGMVRGILGSATGNQNLTNTARICLEVLNYSEYRTNATVGALASGGGSIKDARAWASAALAYQYDCWGGLKYVNATSPVASEAMSFFNDTLIVSTSNALAMVVNYDIYGDKTGSWGPVRTERDGFWEPGLGSGPSSVDSAGGVPKDLKVDVTVCKNGTGCGYRTVQEAVDAAPENSDLRFVIRIREGVYEEIVRVPFEKRNLVFLGEGKGKTVITGSLNVRMQGVTTYSSATVGVLGDGFMASNLTIQNTAGADAHQAVAFRSDSDLSVIEDCEFIGNQDTLYVHSLRQYYKSCLIQGNIDFIFGNSAAFFQDCLILVGPRQAQPEKGENNAATAQGRTDPGQSTGFVFQNCVINGTDAYMSLYYKNPSVHKNYLGRPWKEYSRTVFVGCTIEALISPEGWMIWSGDFALKTLYYGEFANKGPGADTSGRVSWSSKIPADRAYSYSLRNFIQGDRWIPASS